MTLAVGSVIPDPKYRGRVSLTASDKTITLTLKAINRDDVIHGAYSLIGSVVIDNHIETIADNSASIYLFGKYTILSILRQCHCFYSTLYIQTIYQIVHNKFNSLSANIEFKRQIACLHLNKQVNQPNL